MSDSNKLVLTVVIGILVGLVLGRLLWYGKVPSSDVDSYGTTTSSSEDIDATADVTTTTTSKLDTDTSISSTDSVAVARQTAGDSVLVSVVAKETVWVMVRDNKNGSFGNILGAKHFGPGSATVAVPLQRETEAGNSYYVVLAPYNNGVLPLAVSAHLVDASGKVIARTFDAE